jgi:hypothetical protein
MAVANPQKLMGTSKTTQSAVQPQQQLIAAPADIETLQGISRSLTQIIQLLGQQNSQVTAEATQERKNQENARRKKIELGLENSFAAVKNVAQAVVAPVKNILDSIIQFFVTLFLGKAILNLLDWFSKEENQGKVRSIARFLKDWWPALVAAYILFGTGFGRVVRNLAGIAVRAVGALGGIILKLSAAILKATGFKKAGAAMSALGGGGGWKGSLARMGVGLLAAGGTAVVANKMMGGGDAPQVAVPEPAPIPTPEMFGGGLIDFKTMLAASGGQVDSKLGIFAQLFGSGGFAGLMNSVPGFVSGPKGIDKVPAMLTDGEFVMSRGAVQKFGVSNLEAMNAAGGGTNRPKIVEKRIHAEGGGLVKMQGGGFLDTLGRFLPGTGTVMAPRTSGPADVKGNRQTDPGFQSKFLGIPLGSPTSGASSRFGMTAPLGPGGDVGGYTKEQKKRYASRTGSSFVPTSYAGSISGAMGDSHLRFPGLPSLQNKKIEIPDYMMPSTPVSKSQQQTRQPSSPITLQNNQNLNLAIQNARDVTNMPGGAVYRPLVESAINSSIKTQTRYDTLRNVMRQTGTSGDDENMNMRGNIIKKQGGGLFGGTKTPSTPGYGVRGGGIIKENTGIDIPGGGADRQNVRVQPGEYIIPKKVVDTVGVNLLDKRVANIDKNSNPYKLGADRQIEPQSPPISRLNPAQIQTKNNIPRITPTPRPAPKIVSAPSVAGGGMSGRRGSSAKATIPQFNPSKNNSKIAKQLGIK